MVHGNKQGVEEALFSTDVDSFQQLPAEGSFFGSQHRCCRWATSRRRIPCLVVLTFSHGSSQQQKYPIGIHSVLNELLGHDTLGYCASGCSLGRVPGTSHTELGVHHENQWPVVDSEKPMPQADQAQ